MTKTERLVLVFIIFGTTFSTSFVQSPRTYVERLRALRGTSYFEFSCTEYICYARRHANCSAASMFEGCDGSMTVEQQVSSFSEVDRKKLMPGDVIAFNHMHAAAYLGNGEWMDSTPGHFGVGPMKKYHLSLDPWFSGPVRILRWK